MYNFLFSSLQFFIFFINNQAMLMPCWTSIFAFAAIKGIYLDQLPVRVPPKLRDATSWINPVMIRIHIVGSWESESICPFVQKMEHTKNTWNIFFSLSLYFSLLSLLLFFYFYSILSLSLSFPSLLLFRSYASSSGSWPLSPSPLSLSYWSKERGVSEEVWSVGWYGHVGR